MKVGKSEKTPKGKWQARKEVKKLFNYSGAKRKKREEGGVEWKHKFFCLAFHDQRRIPTTDVEKDDLLQAGLGEKEIWVNNLEMNAEEFRDLLYFHYPQLCTILSFVKLEDSDCANASPIVETWKSFQNFPIHHRKH